MPIFIHLNINSLLPKIDKLQAKTKISNAMVIGITESKLDELINDSEIFIKGYIIIQHDRNKRGGGGVRAYSRPLLGVTIAPNLVTWVLKKIFSLEMCRNDIYLWGGSKQNALFLENLP